MRGPTISRRARWAIPAGTLAVVAAVAAGTVAVTSAQASPLLPARTPAQLLAALSGRTGPVPAFTGMVVETAALGLPDLPGMDEFGSVTSLLSGSHQVNIWYSSPRHLRISVPQTMSESDLFVDGSTAWSWDSTGNQVTRYLLPAGTTRQLPQMPVLTPQQAAQQALAAVGPTTRVTLQRNVMVAGQPAYQLVLTPRSPQSLVGRVTIAIDGNHDIPLRVQVFARGAASPAFGVGFDSISFVQPAAADLAFTPPPGAAVTTERLTGRDLPGARAMQRRALADEPKTFGTSWLTVAEVSSADLSGALLGMSGVQVSLHTVRVHPPGGMFGSSSQQAVGSAESSSARYVAGQVAAGGPGGIDAVGLFGVVMSSATRVHGAWGSGRLLRTSLLSVLLTSDGRVFLGAVTPAVLYHDAAVGR